MARLAPTGLVRLAGLDRTQTVTTGSINDDRRPRRGVLSWYERPINEQNESVHI